LIGCIRMPMRTCPTNLAEPGKVVPTRRFLAAIAAGSAAVTLVALAPAALATSRRVAMQAHAYAGRAGCSSTSLTGTKPSVFNTAPAHIGTWHVPIDPCNTEGTGSGRTPYYNCAYWGAEKRPDIWVHAVWTYGYTVAPYGAWNVEIDARRAGFVINHRPRVGDLAAWPPNARMGTWTRGSRYRTFQASPGGHVGYVQKVRGTTITISTMGVASTHGVTERFTFNKRKTYFIHHRRD
jgi:surface antigen